MAETPEWIDKTPSEIEELVVGLRERGNSPSEIGTILRDQYGVPSAEAVLGKSVLEILESHDSAPDIPEELMDLMEKAVNLRDHLDKHGEDVRSQRALDALESRIHKLTKYYKKENRLSQDWRYDPEKAALLVQS